jgi:recombination protein RecA
MTDRPEKKPTKPENKRREKAAKTEKTKATKVEKEKKHHSVDRPKTEKEKNDVLETAIATIRKAYGSDAIMPLENRVRMDIPYLSTNITSVDLAIGIGGLPRGRIIEIFGPEGAGKTSFCLKVIAAIQQNGGKAAIIDVEHALSIPWARKMGVNTEEAIISQPENGVRALIYTQALIRTGALDVIVVDSVAGLLPVEEEAKEIGDSSPGSQARLLSQAMRKLPSIVARTKTILIFTNQIREKIGVMFGNPETTPGGHGLKHAASVRIDIRKGKPIKKGDIQTGQEPKIKIVKNKVATPYKETTVPFYFDSGFDCEEDLLNCAIENGTLTKNGAWITFDGTQLAHGQEAARQFLKDPANADVANKIRQLTIEKVLAASEIIETKEHATEEITEADIKALASDQSNDEEINGT